MTADPVDGDAPKVLQMRLVVTAEDLDAALAFYRDTLGLSERLAVDGPDGARVVILDAGRATLELINSAQRRYIDDVEVGRQVSRPVRVAFEVEDSASATEELTETGAELLAAPVETPWGTLNSRLEAPAGLQITIFQELGPSRGCTRIPVRDQLVDAREPEGRHQVSKTGLRGKLEL